MLFDQGLEPGARAWLVCFVVALEDLISGFDGLGGPDGHISIVVGDWVNGLGVAFGRVIGELCSISKVEKEVALLHKQSAAEYGLQFLVAHGHHLFSAECPISLSNMPKNR